MVEWNAKIGKEKKKKITTGMKSLYTKTNDNRQRLIHFAAAQELIIKSTALKAKGYSFGLVQTKKRHESKVLTF